MTHLGERITDFVFEELPAAEMTEARRHVAECSECGQKVEQLRRTYALLKVSPDVNPPRQIVFEVEKPAVASWVWRWVGPMAAAAALAMAVVTFAPRPAPQIVERVVVQQPVAQPVAQNIDYDRIVTELRASEQTWLANELKKRDAAHTAEIEGVRGQLALMDAYQRADRRDTIQNSALIQMALTQKTDTRD